MFWWRCESAVLFSVFVKVFAKLQNKQACCRHKSVLESENKIELMLWCVQNINQRYAMCDKTTDQSSKIHLFSLLL